MSDEGNRLEFLEERVLALEESVAKLTKWMNFNPQQNNTMENNGASGTHTNGNGVTTSAASIETAVNEGNVQNKGNPEVDVDIVCKVEAIDANDDQQGNLDGIDIPQGTSDEPLLHNPNPAGSSPTQLADQCNENRKTSTATRGSVDDGGNQGSKNEGPIPPQIKTEASAKFYIKEESKSDPAEDKTTTSGGSLESTRKVQKRKRSPQKQSTTTESSEDSLKKLASNSQILTKKTTMGDKSILKCPHCPRIFHSKSQLIDHSNIHSNKPFNCAHCNYSTAWGQGANLNRHIRKMHPNVKQPLPCSRIPKVKKIKQSLPRQNCSSWNNLKKDGQLHCYFCSYKANFVCNLVSHVRSHTGEKPYSCPRCSYDAKDSATLKSHLYNHCK